MIRLRALSAASNVCFVIYAFFDGQYPTLFLQGALLPLNVLRMHQMIRLVKRARASAQGDQAMDWLKPYMTHKRCRRGEIIFRKGDKADAMYYISSGSFRLSETGIRLEPGQFVGELGLLAPTGQRTQSLECTADGHLMPIQYDQVRELFFQNPDFGFYFMQLAASRLFKSLEMLEEELAARSTPVDAA
ncbi:MAG TPA: cyclic nucleotide-binding domain-containing protein [Acetobacteraceae bacterium]|jgi:CRP-like cAMP-binding protein|nr:cyclic nucleotide-binding domain-containing protein [Acetobacteraceae bacterium]